VATAGVTGACCTQDDNWQACGKGVNGSFHASDGTPLINTEAFPSMTDMTAHGHKLGLRVGWYMNNCICSERQFTDPVRKKENGSLQSSFLTFVPSLSGQTIVFHMKTR
jgi:hypothetical protein